MARHFWLFIILSLFPGTIHAQIVENALLLQEVSFNTTPDYLTFKNVSNTEVNIKGLEFWDDKLFKKIENDYFIAPEQSITLTFNSTESDQTSINKIFTTYKGLTATTEQIILKQANLTIDFFCWKSAKPSQAELKEWENNNYSQFWNNQTLESCFSSEGLKKSQSLQRISLGRTIANWKAQSLPEKTSTKSTSKTTSKSTNQKSSNVTLSNDQTPTRQILISEIFPAPDKKSSQNQEWIELYNHSNSDINLRGWYLDDQEGGSKPYQLGNTTLATGSTLLISAEQSKLNLNNSDEQVRLFNSQKQLIDLLEYKKSVNAQSYNLINIQNNSKNPLASETLWLWSSNTTPNQSNPQLISMEGVVSLPAQFQTPYFFEITSNAEQSIIIFDEKTLPAPLAKSLLIPNQPIKILAFPLDSKTINNAPDQPFFQLHSLETLSDPAPPAEDFNLNLPIICVIILAALYLLQKKYQWIKLI
ncbi:MAG: lamin tail domain-containing protein [Candidatus Altimarinota bacterium]